MLIATLAAAHNRRAKTLRALSSLHAQSWPSDAEVLHVLVDDGSTDGTTEAVRHAFPDVQIVRGDGTLYWSAGMRFGWERLLQEKDIDALIVYNDDVELHKDAVQRLLQASVDLHGSGQAKHVVAAPLTDRLECRTTYGGMVRSISWLPMVFRLAEPSGSLQRIDTVNMNLALISKEALQAVGFFSPAYRHNGADFDYGLRLNKAGGSCWLLDSSAGWCDANPDEGTSREPGISLLERFRRATSVREQPVRQRIHFFRANGGILGLLVVPAYYVKLVMLHLRMAWISQFDNS